VLLTWTTKDQFQYFCQRTIYYDITTYCCMRVSFRTRKRECLYL